MASSRVMCEIPVDVLNKQLLIDSIPSCMMVTILLISTVLAVIWYIQYNREKELSFRVKTFYILSMCIVLFGLWYQASFLIQSILTNITNPEYASLLKFIQGCPSSIK